MKTFLVSMLMLGILLAAILCNAFYVRGVTEELKDELEALTTHEQAQEILKRWESEANLLGLSVSATDINDISDQLTELCTTARLNDKEAFERARALCLLGLTRIHDFERFSFLHIL